MSKKLQRNLANVLLILLASLTNSFAQSNDNPCTSGSFVLAATNRGGLAYSPCVLPFKTAFLEGGYQYEAFQPGWQQNSPQGEFRIGLPGNTEVGFILPNYNWGEATISGYSSFKLNLKHALVYSQNWIITGNALLITPGGSAAYGSADLGTALTPIVTYNLNEQWSLTGMLEVASVTTSTLAGGERYTSFIPDILVSYSPTENLNLYAELYSLSKTGPHEASATVVDYGLLYMLTSRIAIDLEFYKQFGNNPNLFHHSFVGGITVSLG
ncbi:transporter [Legionella clemsonensis]|uniref:Transporter n=1 Tax=Legionella clemsonensis TaxID=1867846 RepID=A0A222P3G1_9GAMM|nr:transporter [Legionella clemsonensis]ASQ46388.1 hypothetical protein clem_09185 [Legionella clemsonensis]